MFVRRKKNESGSISVQIIDKTGGSYRVIKTLGSSHDPDEVERLVQLGISIINKKDDNQLRLFAVKTEVEREVENFITSNSNVRTIGPELIFGALFDRIGFNKIEDELFRHVSIARLSYPTSKLKTVDYLYRYRGIEISVDSIYRFLDKLASAHKQTAQEIAFEYTKRRLKHISVVFYDMTTLYFEAEDEDDLRKIGFSKDGKFQKPQIMLGLLVGELGYPIGYDIFEGNTFEGHTLVPVLEAAQAKYGFNKPIVIADAALLSKKNLENLSQQNYEFIIGARIKNETASIKNKILEQTRDIKDGQGIAIKKPDGTRLIVTYSDKRRRKDAFNRERGLRKLRERVKCDRLTKESINNRGYNKFLKLIGSVAVEIDEDKIKEDERFDGLKGYITNTKLRPNKIAENYRHLWQIEKAFRISKTDLKIRPIYHHLRDRIEAHICVAFVAYTIYKELERLLYKHNAGFSPKRAAELTHNMYALECVLPNAPGPETIVLKMDEEQQLLHNIIQKN